MSIRLVMGGTWRPVLIMAAFLIAASPASAAFLEISADSDDLDQPGAPNSGAPEFFPDNAYAWSADPEDMLGSMRSFTLDVCTETDLPPGYDKIVDVEMSLWLNHGAVGEVFAKLESPSGTVITIINRPGLSGAADGEGRTGNNARLSPDVEFRFYDDASVSAEEMGKDLTGIESAYVHDRSGTEYAPYADESIHDGGFAAFTGEDPDGTWTLYVADTAQTWMGGIDSGQGGELHRWKLDITVIPEPATLAVFGMGGALLAARRRSRRGLPTG